MWRGSFACLVLLFVGSQVEAGTCSRWLSSAAIAASLSATASADIISSEQIARDRILFEPSTYFRDPRGIIDFREPSSWLFSNETSYLYSNPGQFSQSLLIRSVFELDPDLMPEEAEFGLWVDYRQLSNSPHWYSYRVYDYWAGQVTTYRWYLYEPLSGPRPIILDEGGFYVSNPIPTPGAITLFALAALAQRRSR